MSVADPAADLALADAASRRLRGRAQWVRRYYVLQAAHWIIWILFLGLVHLPSMLGPISGTVGAFILLLVMMGADSLIDLWAGRQGVVLRGSRRLRLITWLVTAPISGGAVFWGVRRSFGDPAFWFGPTFWFSAAVLVAIPSLVAAVVAGRAVGPR